MNEDEKIPTWFLKWWRPLMAWQYFIICMFDFLFAPILIGIFGDYNASKIIQWEPLTLHGGGLYHLSMMAIVGVTAWSRGQERINYYKSSWINPYTPDFEGYNNTNPYDKTYNQAGLAPSYIPSATDDNPVQHLNEISDGPENPNEDLSKPILIRKN